MHTLIAAQISRINETAIQFYEGIFEFVHHLTLHLQINHACLNEIGYEKLTLLPMAAFVIGISTRLT